MTNDIHILPLTLFYQNYIISIKEINYYLRNEILYSNKPLTPNKEWNPTIIWSHFMYLLWMDRIRYWNELVIVLRTRFILLPTVKTFISYDEIIIQEIMSYPLRTNSNDLINILIYSTSYNQIRKLSVVYKSHDYHVIQNSGMNHDFYSPSFSSLSSLKSIYSMM